MLIKDSYQIGAKLHASRKRISLTQWDVAEQAGISSRTYADIERGTVNPRIETILNICEVLKITPNDIFVDQESVKPDHRELLLRHLDSLSLKDQELALKMLEIYCKAVSSPSKKLESE